VAPTRISEFFFRALSRFSLFSALVCFAVPFASAQAPLLQDGVTALRQARLDWTLGQAPLPPSSLPFFEVGLGGTASDGVYTPLTEGEGLGQGTTGWGLGLQGRYVRGAWSFSATALALRDHGHTLGLLQRAALAYQTESGWRVALEQAPFAWGSGLNGGDLLGDASRSFPRLSLATPEVALPLGRWRLEAFAGRLDAVRPIPEWISDREARIAAQAGGFDLQRPILWGGLVRAAFGPLLETSLGAITMEGGRDDSGRPAPAAAARTETLTELRLRLPVLAQLVRARGASVVFSRCGTPDSDAVALRPGRALAGLQLVWDGWDVGLEYAGAAQSATPGTFSRPTNLAGFSVQGDSLGPAFGAGTITRTVELGLPLFLEGQGRIKALRATAALDQPSGSGAWFLQSDAQWRTPTGRVGTSLASRRNELPGSSLRWGWACSIFQAFRVF
jgi:hypothetical protein